MQAAPLNIDVEMWDTHHWCSQQ